MELNPGHWEWKGQPLTIKNVALIFGFIPGWGGMVSAVCTIIATFTGFKAGVKIQREIIG